LSDKSKNRKQITFTLHAKEKFKRLISVGVTEESVIEAVENPESVIEGNFGRKIAQTAITEDILLRIIYEETDNNILVVTIYPAKRQRYE
jgi:hypothetical protein